VDVRTGNGTESELITGQRMGRIGAELVMKATICAAMIALVAGMVAVVVGF